VVRYIDTGRRNPQDALGTWLRDALSTEAGITAVRWQSGFFGAPALGYLTPVLAQLAAAEGDVAVLVGSNDGATGRHDLALLLEVLGPPRPNLRVGVISFDNAYFHPKTFHLSRGDASAAGYVGSANFTRNGVEGRHVEAGICLDSADGDSLEVLGQLAAAIDWWFEGPREGLFPISTELDLDALVESGVIGVPRPTRHPRLPASPDAPARPLVELASLVTAPPLGNLAEAATRPTARPQRGTAGQGEVTPEAEWEKTLSRSDAQRKRTGNQRGSITLVRGRRADIDTQTYFRRDFFGAASWSLEQTRTGQPRERTDVTMSVSILGRDLGLILMPVTCAPNRESAQANYTTLLHLGPLAGEFAARDLTGRVISLRRSDEGRFSLTID
jgi:hypothetical protein